MVETVCVKLSEKAWFHFNIENDKVISSGYSDKYVEEKFTSKFARDVRQQVLDYLNGEYVNLQEIPTEDQREGFSKQVFDALKQVPYRQKITYGEIAEMIGNPKAAQAVGRVMGQNKLPLFIPCHRVVSKTGLGGFMRGAKGGLDIEKL